MAYLTLLPSDPNFKDNLLAIRETRIANRATGLDFEVTIKGKITAARYAYVGSDGFFHMEARCVDVDCVEKVLYNLGGY